jgi:DnaK suppressor protein
MAALTPSQMDQLATKLKADYQTLLLEVREELENRGVQHRIDLLNSEPGDSGDESMANALADVNIKMVDRQVQEIRDIETTFKRIKDGTFGMCIDCGEAIPFNRLQAYPTAKRCIACQEKREKQYGQEGHSSM